MSDHKPTEFRLSLVGGGQTSHLVVRQLPHSSDAFSSTWSVDDETGAIIDERIDRAINIQDALTMVRMAAVEAMYMVFPELPFQVLAQQLGEAGATRLREIAEAAIKRDPTAN